LGRGVKVPAAQCHRPSTGRRREGGPPQESKVKKKERSAKKDKNIAGGVSGQFTRGVSTDGASGRGTNTYKGVEKKFTRNGGDKGAREDK